MRIIPWFMASILAGLAGCTTSTSRSDSADIHRFKVGELELTALRDGEILVPNDGKTFAINAAKADVDRLLDDAGLPTDKLRLDLSALLVRSADRLILLDAGGGPLIPTAGRLTARLRDAAVDPGAITDVVISHAHADHAGGLIDASGKLAFPNARIHMVEAEWGYLQSRPVMSAVAAAIKPRLALFSNRTEVAPGITAFEIKGHTPGHVGAEVVSDGSRLLYVGDTAHHFVISLANPDWTITYDVDAPVAQASRRVTFGLAASEGWQVYAPHFPFPGLGRVEQRGTGYVWKPAVRREGN